jgi:predicted ATPase
VEFDAIDTLRGAQGDRVFAFQLDGETFPARVLSDGTLRFAALAAAFFQPDLPYRVLIEEIEDGIHPARLRLLVELLRSQAGRPQILATTHSPLVVAWLKEEDYAFTFLCRKNGETGASEITPFSQMPRLVEIARKQPLAELFAEGWLENAL